jgi:hypothetical protein
MAPKEVIPLKEGNKEGNILLILVFTATPERKILDEAENALFRAVNIEDTPRIGTRQIINLWPK